MLGVCKDLRASCVPWISLGSLPLLSLALFVLVAEADDLNDFLLVKIFEARRRDDIVVILLREEQASLLQALTVEGVRVLEDLAHRLNRDVLSQDHLATLLERGYVESVSELKEKSLSVSKEIKGS